MANVEKLTTEQVRERIEELAQTVLHVSADEALRQLDAGELDERVVSSQLRMLRFLLDEPEYRDAAE